MFWRSALLFSLFLAGLGTGCTRSQAGTPPSATAPAASENEPAAKVLTLTVGEALSRAKSGGLSWVDANTPQTRESEGIIPNAVLLSSFNGFDERELGPDKDRTYVFYCVNRL